jgi:hypothetical protein
MKNWLLGKLLGFAGKKLDGYKTKIGGVGLILVGIAGIIAKLFPDQNLPEMDLDAAIASIAAGVAALGLGHKAEKTRAAVEATMPPVVSLPEPEISVKQGERPSAGVTGSASVEPSPPPKWNSRVPGQFP